MAFQPVDEPTWRAAVTAKLAGKSFEKTLIASTPEGLPIAPLYLSGPPRPPLLATRPAGFRVGVVATNATLARTLGEASENGVEAVWLEPDASALPTALSSDVPVFVDAGEHAFAVSRSLGRAGLRAVHPLYDPFSSALRRGGTDRPLAELVASAVGDPDACGRASLAVSPRTVTEAGGTDAQAIGYALASSAELLRAASDRTAVARAIALVVATTGEVFRGIVLVRALRLAFAKLCAAFAVDPGAPLVVGRSARRLRAALDTPTNVLRSSNEAVALIVGGADAVMLDAFELDGQADELGARLARNTLLVLREESHLGRVVDAAGGSYFVESLTDGLARAGWEELARIEAEGGLVRSLAEGAFQSRVREAEAARARDIARRKLVLVGVNEFAAPDPGAAHVGGAASSVAVPVPIAPLSFGRDAEPFEHLRARAAALVASGVPPHARLLLLGPPADHRAREGFARRFAEVGGLEVDSVVLGEGEEARSATARSLSERPVDVAILCSSDERYEAEGAALFAAARQAGTSARLVLAGRPGALEAAFREAGMDDAIFVGCDAVERLSAWLDVAATRGGAR